MRFYYASKVVKCCTCEKAEREGREIREEVDIYLDINQYEPHSFDTPKGDKAYPPQNVEEMFTGIPYFFGELSS